MTHGTSQFLHLVVLQGWQCLGSWNHNLTLHHLRPNIWVLLWELQEKKKCFDCEQPGQQAAGPPAQWPVPAEPASEPHRGPPVWTIMQTREEVNIASVWCNLDNGVHDNFLRDNGQQIVCL